MQLTTSYQKLKEVKIGNSGYGDFYLRVYAKYTSQSIENNTSTVYYQSRVYLTGSSGSYVYSGTTTQKSLSGTSATAVSKANAAGTYNLGETTLSTITGTVKHNSDGTASVSTSANFYSSPWGWNATASATATLPTIPRASKLTALSMTISNNGTSVKVTPTFTRYSSSFTDNLVLTGGGQTIATISNVSNGVEVSLTTAQINSLWTAFGTAKTLTISGYLQTKSGSTNIGNSNTYQITVDLPTYTLSGTISAADTVSTYNTYKPTATTFISGLSKPKLTFSATSSTGSTYGRTITYTLENTAITSPYTISDYTGQSLSVVASDGRNSKTLTPTATVVNYSKPIISTANIVRPSPTGSTATVSISGSYYDGNGLTNLLTPSATIKWTEDGGTQHSATITLTAGSTTNHITSYTGSYTITGLTYTKKFNWQIELKDKINISVSTNGLVPQGLPVWNAYADGTSNVFNVNGSIQTTKNNLKTKIGSDNTSFCHYITDAPKHWFNKPVCVQGDIYSGSSYNQKVLNAANIKTANTTSAADTYSCTYINTIVESGSNTNGHWIKYIDGTMICTQTINVGQVNVNTAWGSMYIWAEANTVWHTFPQTFTEIYSFSLEIGTLTTAYGFWLADYGRRKIELSRWTGLCFMRPTASAVNAVIHSTAIGKWK